MNATATRHANMKLTRSDQGTVLNVAVPRDVTVDELGKLNHVIVNDLIRRLTGCPCLSGQVKVVLEDDFQEVIRVDLARGQIQG